MNWPKIIALSFIPVVSAAQESAPNEIVLEATEIRDMDSCIDVLAEFKWICQEFNHTGWVNSYENTYWEVGRLLFYRFDLDGDSLDDGILKIEHVGWCGAGLSCSHLFLFGDQPVADHPHYTINSSDGNPVLSIRSGRVEHIHWSLYPDIYYRVSELREMTLGTPQKSLHVRPVGE